MKFKYVFSILLFLFFANTLYAQEEKPLDVIYLKNGSVFKGRVVNYQQGKQVELKIDDDRVFVFDAKTIRRIIQEGDIEKEAKQSKTLRIKKEYQFREKGWYNTTYISVAIGGSAFDAVETDLGFGVSTVIGYKFNRLLGVGAGIGMDYYYSGSGKNFMPVFGEIKGYVLSRNITPTYSFAAGYGFTFEDENRNIEKTKGGMMIYPAVGFRFGGSKAMNFVFDAGVKIQKGTFTYQQWEVTNEYQMTYKRLVLRAGVTF